MELCEQTIRTNVWQTVYERENPLLFVKRPGVWFCVCADIFTLEIALPEHLKRALFAIQFSNRICVTCSCFTYKTKLKRKRKLNRNKSDEHPHIHTLTYSPTTENWEWASNISCVSKIYFWDFWLNRAMVCCRFVFSRLLLLFSLSIRFAFFLGLLRFWLDSTLRLYYMYVVSCVPLMSLFGLLCFVS